MKAVLVIDMPVNGCESCMFDSYGCRCLIKANMLDIEKMTNEKYCPLKPMPNKIPFDESFKMEDYAKGFNACLEEITK